MHHNILDSLADAVITVDTDNQVSYINPAGCELFQCEAAEVVGKPYPALFRPDADFNSPIVDTLQTGREHHGIEVDYPLPHRTPRESCGDVNSRKPPPARWCFWMNRRPKPT